MIAEYIVGADGALLAAIIALAYSLARTREQLARLEGKLEQLGHDRDAER